MPHIILQLYEEHGTTIFAIVVSPAVVGLEFRACYLSVVEECRETMVYITDNHHLYTYIMSQGSCRKGHVQQNCPVVEKALKFQALI